MDNFARCDFGIVNVDDISFLVGPKEDGRLPILSMKSGKEFQIDINSYNIIVQHIFPRDVPGGAFYRKPHTF